MDRIQTNNTLILTDFFHLRVVSVIWHWQISKIEKKIATDSNYLRCHSFAHSTWLSNGNYLFLYAGYKRAVLGTTILANGKAHFGRPKWPYRSLRTTFKAGPEYSGWTRPKWSVRFDEPTEISGILGWMESARKHALINFSWIIQKCWERSRKFTQRMKAALIRNTQQRQNVCVQHFLTLNSS